MSRDTESPRGEWGGPRAEAGTALHRGRRRLHDDRPEPEDFAATEPLMAADQSPPVEPTPVTEPDVREQYAAGTSGESAQRRRPRDAARAAPRATTPAARSAAATAPSSSATRTPTRPPSPCSPVTPRRAHSTAPAPESSVDEGVGSDGTDLGDRSGYGDGDRAEVGDRGDSAPTARTSSDRRSVHARTSATTEYGDATARISAPAQTSTHRPRPARPSRSRSTGTPAHGARAAEERFDPTPTRDWAADEGELLDGNHERADRLAEERGRAATPDAPVQGGTAQRAARRISDFHELRDGGFGVGSAAPLDDGVQPLDHPVQGFRESMTFGLPGDPRLRHGRARRVVLRRGAAERSGFRRSGG